MFLYDDEGDDEMGNDYKYSEIRILVSPALKRDLDALAKERGTSVGVLAKDILKLYMREKYYKKAEELLNLEDRFGTVVAVEMDAQLEELRKDIKEIKDTIKNVKLQGKKENEDKKAGKTLYSSAEKEKEKTKKKEEVEEKKKEEGKEKKSKLIYPNEKEIPVGLNYKIEDDEFLVYDDGSAWSLKLGAWITRGPKVMKLKRKRDKELGR